MQQTNGMLFARHSTTYSACASISMVPCFPCEAQRAAHVPIVESAQYPDTRWNCIERLVSLSDTSHPRRAGLLFIDFPIKGVFCSGIRCSGFFMITGRVAILRICVEKFGVQESNPSPFSIYQSRSACYPFDGRWGRRISMEARIVNSEKG